MRRKTHLGAAIFLSSGAALAAAATEGLSPQAAKLIEPWHQVYPDPRCRARAPARLRQKPPGDKLERICDDGQANHGIQQDVDVSKLPKTQQTLAKAAMDAEIAKHDLANQKILKALIPAIGWFKVSSDGERATLTAFLIVQHAGNDPQLMREALPRLKTEVDAGEASAQWYVLLYDRVAVEFDHKAAALWHSTQLRTRQVATREGR